MTPPVIDGEVEEVPHDPAAPLAEPVPDPVRDRMGAMDVVVVIVGTNDYDWGPVREAMAELGQAADRAFRRTAEIIREANRRMHDGDPDVGHMGLLMPLAEPEPRITRGGAPRQTKAEGRRNMKRGNKR